MNTIIHSIKNHVYCFKTPVSYFHCSSVCSDKFTAFKQSRMMNKLMGNSPHRKKWYSLNKEGSMFPSTNSITKTKGQHGKSSLRRISVLNKLFIASISDVMTTGEIADLVAGRGIEISQVKVSPDFNGVNVFWVAKGIAEDATTEKILNNIAFLVRHELSQLRVMGVVPKIIFVKDKQYARFVEVDQLLTEADFGDDFEPQDTYQMLKSEFILNTKLDPQIKERISKLESEEEVEELPFPTMKNDVLGLDRDVVMNRITNSIQRSKDAWKRAALNEEVQNHQLNNNYVTTPENYMTSPEQKRQFLEFLRSRQILKKKAMENSAVYNHEDDTEDTQEEDQYIPEDFESNEEIFEEDDDYNDVKKKDYFNK